MAKAVKKAAGALIEVSKNGLYCSQGEFFIDPWGETDLALITHAHADHARRGSRRYLATRASEPILRARLGEDINLQTVDYGERLPFGDTWVSFHPAGHVLGSAQVRVERGDEVWVVSGDYKRAPDPTCEAFEPVQCMTFITEATFGLPVYRWSPPERVAKDIFDWWTSDPARPSLLFCYAFGKAQRVLAELTRFTDRTVYLHGAVARLTELYREQGIKMLPTENVSDFPKNHDFGGELVIAPPSGHRSSWMKRFKLPQTAFASGWMAVRGNRRRRGYERGFVLSDHADWSNLIRSIDETGAKTVFATHGQTDVLSRFLRETRGLDARPLPAPYEGEEADETGEVEDAP